MSEDIFDRVVHYEDIDSALEQDLSGQTVQICTVRQSKLSDVALGNLYWLLQAGKARQRGAKVMVTDFYDRPGSSNQGILKLMAILHLSGDGVQFRRAEDVPRDEQLWQDISAHIHKNGEAGLTWAMIGHVGDGIREVLNDSPEDIPSSMDRLIEELSVWVDGIDDESVVQLMNHEVQSTTWVRRLRAKVKKHFWNVKLPFVNEYRGRYKDVTGPDPVIIQRRLQDLSGKLAIGRTGGEEDEHASFYEALFHDLVGYLTEEGRRRAKYDWDNPETLLLQALVDLDPKLLDFYLSDKDPEKIYPRDVLEAHPAATLETALQIGRAELEAKEPSLKRIIAFASIASDKWLNSRKLTTLLLDSRFSASELCELWDAILSSRDLEITRDVFTHPVSDKLAALSPEISPAWRRIRDRLISDDNHIRLGQAIQKASDPLAVPMIKAIFDDLFTENPNLVRVLMDRLKKFRLVLNDEMLFLTQNGSVFAITVLERLMAENPAQAEYAKELIQQIRNGYIPSSRWS